MRSLLTFSAAVWPCLPTPIFIYRKDVTVWSGYKELDLALLDISQLRYRYTIPGCIKIATEYSYVQSHLHINKEFNLYTAHLLLQDWPRCTTLIGGYSRRCQSRTATRRPRRRVLPLHYILDKHWKESYRTYYMKPISP